MPRLIDAYKLKSCFTPALTGRTEYSADEILLTIATMPTVDAEPVVRCKECKRNETELCPMLFTTMKDNDFCSYGERREDAEKTD